jgi:hypothetical protein
VLCGLLRALQGYLDFVKQNLAVHLAATGVFTDTVHLNDLYPNLIHCSGFQRILKSERK